MVLKHCQLTIGKILRNSAIAAQEVEMAVSRASRLTSFRSWMIEGWLTRIRRVKCGEERPTCIRCTSTGRKCDGYVETRPRANAKSKTKPPLPKLSEVGKKKWHRGQDCSSLIVPRGPCVDIEGSFKERRSFYYFRSRNMSSMPGNFEPYFWDHLVLQFSHCDPTIRYSLIALSAIYEEHETSVAHGSACPVDKLSARCRSAFVYCCNTYTLWDWPAEVRIWSGCASCSS